MRMNRRTATQSIAAAAAGGFLNPKLHAAGQGRATEQIRTQVCVIGGGSGRIGAALTAARTGAAVVLIEQESILGGTSTNAWVHTWEPVSGADGIPRELYAFGV